MMYNILDVIYFSLGAAGFHGGTLRLGFGKQFMRVCHGISFHVKRLAMHGSHGVFFPSALPLHDVVDGLIGDGDII